MNSISAQLAVYLAAGGKSSRFGSEKARASCGGEVLIQRLARLLAPWASSLTVVTAPGNSFADLALSSIEDLHPGIGPLAAVHAALAHVRNAEWILLASCDLLIVKPAWIETLLAARKPHARAVAFQHPDGALEPLLGLYRTDLLTEVETRIRAGRNSPSQLLRDMAENRQAILLPLPGDWPDLAHVNTPEELARAMNDFTGHAR